MSEGYERRPEEEQSLASRLFISLMLCGFCAMGLCLSVMSLQSQIRILEQKNAALTKQLDFHTCRVQFEPMPVPEQVNEGPTLIEDDEQIIPQVEMDEQVPTVGAVGASPRSGRWPAVRAAYFAEHPHCEFSGCKSTGPFNVHHVKPFHLHPELELDHNNLITLCTGPENHHLYVGHNGNFQDVNEHCRADCAAGKWPAVGLRMKQKHDGKVPSKTMVSP